MKDTANRLSNPLRICVAFIMAISIAALGLSASSYVRDALANTPSGTYELVAFSADTKAAPSSLAEAKAELDSANQAKAEAAQERERAEQSLASATAVYNEVANSCSGVLQAAESAKQAAQQAFAAAPAQIDPEIQAAQDRIDEAQNQVAKAKQNKQELETIVATRQKELTDAENDYQAYLNEKGSSQLAQAAANLDAAKKKLAELDVESTAASTEKAQALTKLQDARTEQGNANTKLQKAQEALTSAKAELLRKQESLATAKDNLAALGNAQTVEQAEAAVKSAQAGVDAAITAKATAETNLANAQAAANKASERKDAAQREYDRLTGNTGGGSSASEVELAQQAVAEAQAAYDKAAAESQTTNNGISDAKASLDNAKAQKQAAEQSLASATKEAEKAQAELANAQSAQNENKNSDKESVTTESSKTAAKNGDSINTEHKLLAQDDNGEVDDSTGDSNTGEGTGGDGPGGTDGPDQESPGNDDPVTPTNPNESAEVTSARKELDDAIEALRQADAAVNNMMTLLSQADSNLLTMSNELQTAQANLEAAQKNEANKTSIQADVTRLEGEVASAEDQVTVDTTAQNAAQTEYNAAVAGVAAADKVYQQAVTAAKTAATNYQDQERVVYGSYTPEDGGLQGTYNSILKASNLDAYTDESGLSIAQVIENKAEAVRNALASLTAIKGDVAEAQANIDDWNGKLEDAKTARQTALDKQSRAKQLSYEDAMKNFVSDPDFVYLNQYILDNRNADSQVESAMSDPVYKERYDAALAEKNLQQAAYDAAHGQYVRAEAAVAAAQAAYDQAYAAQNASNNNTNNGGNTNQGGSTSTTKPGTTQPNSNKNTSTANKNTVSSAKKNSVVRVASVKTAAKKAATDAVDTAEATSEDVATVAASNNAVTFKSKKASNTFGFDPVIAIVIGAIALAAVASIVAPRIIRSRRAKVEE